MLALETTPVPAGCHIPGVSVLLRQPKVQNLTLTLLALGFGCRMQNYFNLRFYKVVN